MIAKATLRYARVSPRKANQVIRLIRGKSVTAALAVLAHINKRVSHPINKLVRSALTNAQNKGVSPADEGSLYISKATANSGPTLKRYTAAAFGRAVLILKRTSHIDIELDSKRDFNIEARKPKSKAAQVKNKKTKPKA